MTKTPVAAKLHRFPPPPSKTVDWDWDTVKHVVIQGAAAIRHTLRLLPAHVGLQTVSLGYISQSDVGRTLTVDVYEDGNTIDVISTRTAFVKVLSVEDAVPQRRRS